jgi:putative flippase GtrA
VPVTTQFLKTPVGELRSDPHLRASVARVARYGATSVVAFAVSEITLLALYGWHVMGATEAAVVANLAGTIPSYFMSRYWIWSEAPRARAGRQVVMYWAMSFVCIAGTSLATGAIAGLAPSGHRFHLVVAGMGFLLVNIVFWFAKFQVYQRIIFPVTKQEAVTFDGSNELDAVGFMAVEAAS